MKTYTAEELATILKAHKERYLSQGGNRVDLSYTDLSSANLSYTDLSSANLSYTDLSSANLSYANLSSADLSYTDLSYTDLSYTKINWSSHELIAQILLRAAERDIEKRKIAGLILISTDWCWNKFLNIESDLREWALDTLAAWVTEGDNAPDLLRKRNASGMKVQDDALTEVQ